LKFNFGSKKRILVAPILKFSYDEKLNTRIFAFNLRSAAISKEKPISVEICKPSVSRQLEADW